jgi:preprotein translocase subunit SecF
MAAKKQVIAILFAVFLIMLYISVKAKNNSAIAAKISIALHSNRI